MYLLSLLLTIWSLECYAQDDTGWTSQGYPNPVQQPGLCGRVNRTASLVCDPDGIITAHEADLLDVLLVSVLKETPCPCSTCSGEVNGYNIAVALMKRMSTSGTVFSSPRVRAQAFAMHLRAVAWDYGRCNEGVVILVSQEDRQIYTATGSTAREKLTDSIVDDIYGQTREYFTAGKYADGLADMVTRYKKVLKGSTSTGTAAVIGSMFGVVGACGICVTCVICRNKCDCNTSGSGYSHDYWHRSSPSYWSGGDWSSGGGGGGSSGGDGGGGGGF